MNTPPSLHELTKENDLQIARAISFAENDPEKIPELLQEPTELCPVLGITGTGGAGKSSLTDELIRRFVHDFPEKRVAILSIDPSRRRTGGALLGDRIRMNSLRSEQCFARSLATRSAGQSLACTKDAIKICQHAGFDLIIVETSELVKGTQLSWIYLTSACM